MAMPDFKSPRILKVVPGDGYVLIVSWEDETASRVDLTEMIYRLKHFRPLRNKDRFREVAVEDWGWSISWGDDLDISGERLWELAQEQQASVMLPSEFRTWLENRGLTQEAAADLLGVSKRTVSYYATGALPITRTIALAMRGIDAQATDQASDKILNELTSEFSGYLRNWSRPVQRTLDLKRDIEALQSKFGSASACMVFASTMASTLWPLVTKQTAKTVDQNFQYRFGANFRVLEERFQTLEDEGILKRSQKIGSSRRLPKGVREQREPTRN